MDDHLYFAFLRAVNMAGHNSMRTTELSEMLAETGFPDAKIFIQSGNVVLRSNNTPSRLAMTLHEAIMKKFGYDIAVIVRDMTELEGLKKRNPYLEEELFDPAKMAVLFLDKSPETEFLNRIKEINYPPDKFNVDSDEIFLFCPTGFGRSKLNTNFFEKKLGVKATARNWKTILSLLEIAEKM